MFCGTWCWVSTKRGRHLAHGCGRHSILYDTPTASRCHNRCCVHRHAMQLRKAVGSPEPAVTKAPHRGGSGDGNSAGGSERRIDVLLPKPLVAPSSWRQRREVHQGGPTGGSLVVMTGSMHGKCMRGCHAGRALCTCMKMDPYRRRRVGQEGCVMEELSKLHHSSWHAVGTIRGKGHCASRLRCTQP